MYTTHIAYVQTTAESEIRQMRQVGILLYFGLRIYIVTYSLLSMPPLYAGTLHSSAQPHFSRTPGHNTTARIKKKYATCTTNLYLTLPSSLNLSSELARSANKREWRSKVIVPAICRHYRHLSAIPSTCTTCAGSCVTITIHEQSRGTKVCFDYRSIQAYYQLS
jgi:hypothetical protein